MSSLEEDKRLNSIQYLLQSAAVCRALGGRRIIFHSGSCGKQSREAALEKALDTMRRAVSALDEAGFGDMTLCPETNDGMPVTSGKRVISLYDTTF